MNQTFVQEPLRIRGPIRKTCVFKTPIPTGLSSCVCRWSRGRITGGFFERPITKDYRHNPGAALIDSDVQFGRDHDRAIRPRGLY